MMLIIWLVLGFVLVWGSPSQAACSGSSPTRTAASAAQTDVQDCLNVAVSGDTISVPPGSGTWDYLAIEKEVTLKGSGIGNTNISCSNICIGQVSSRVTTRITGFTFTYVGTGNNVIAYIGKGYDAIAGKTFRLDHNEFIGQTRWVGVYVYGKASGTYTALHLTGLIDHNTFRNAAVLTLATDMGYGEDQLATQSNCWTQNPPLGTGTEYVYIEDNNFIGVDNNTTRSAGDGNHCGRYVFRFNTMTTSAVGIEAHSVQGANRGVHRWEFYGNAIKNTAFAIFFVRAGTGVIFGNRTGPTPYDLVLSSIRSQNAPPPFGGCDGTSTTVDGNVGPYGYMCLDQIGVGYNSSQWKLTAPFAPVPMPAYFWNNLKGSNPETATIPFTVVVSTAIDTSYPSLRNCGTSPCVGNAPLHIMANRDFYNDDPNNCPAGGAACKAGVGVGTLAQRPNSCTTGVAYWATDNGTWNTSTSNPYGVQQNGANGVLYKCTATNAWALYYTPYTYPHPLQTAGATSAPPPAPTNLSVK